LQNFGLSKKHREQANLKLNAMNLFAFRVSQKQHQLFQEDNFTEAFMSTGRKSQEPW
jgi:hypothetical protein